jgi:tRNA pseudouridine32 synthase / 23S rRNA pseudouridine746 synthase
LTCANVLFSDENIIVVNKRHGVPVIPGRGNNPVVSLREQIEHETGERIFVVHRIDQATSGIVIFARNADMHRNLSRQFETRTVQKEYHAVVLGKMSGEGIFNKPIKEFGSGRMGVFAGGKPSETRYEVIEQYQETTLVRVFPLTGRRHQIRVHFYDAGYPVVGDLVYGHDRPVGGVERLMLHAHSVIFYYPGDQQFTISAPFAILWNEIIDRCKSSLSMAMTSIYQKNV